MKKSATSAVRLGIGDAGYPGLARRVRPGSSFGIAVIVLAVVLGLAGAARAENECGRPEAGTPIVCSSSNYDAAADGNIVYRPSETNEGDFTIRLTDDLSIRYDRHDPDDDQLVFPVSGDPLYSAVRIETDADHAGDISLFSSADVTSNGRGISVGHNGESGALHTEISGGSFSIASEWSRAYAIHSYRGDGYETDHEFSGNHDVIVRDVVIDLDGGWGGIVGFQGGEGYLNVAVQDTAIKVDARWATGIFGAHRGTGDVDIEVQSVDIEARGSGAVDGIYGYHLGTGDTTIAVRDVDIEVHSDLYSNGISYFYYGKDGVGNLSIDARDVDIEVHGERYLDGIFGIHRGTGGIDVDVRRGTLVTNGADSGGMSFVHDGDGGIDIAARDVDIEVHGDRSVGIGGGQRYEGTGDIAIDVRDSTVAATGESVAGIRSFHMSGEGSIGVRVDGGTITAEGPGSSGILVGLTGRIFGERTGPIKAPAGGDVVVDGNEPGDSSDADGYRAQSVFVNGRVRGGLGVGAGVRLYGGGQVEIGPRGSVGASSGVAVRAEGDGAVLHVGVALGGRRPAEVIAGEIRNDDGRTTIVVNGTTLHDGMTGATGLRAPHGARDVTLAANDTSAGRAFSAADFVTSYAPRATLYEVVPDFLLRLTGPDSSRTSQPLPDRTVWARFDAGAGSYESTRTTVGAEYDYDRLVGEAGLNVNLGDALRSWVSLSYLSGSADVSSPTGGGEIDADGIGLAVGAHWAGTNDYYALGRFSSQDYKIDFTSDPRGQLKQNVDGEGYYLDVEAGRRFAFSNGIDLTPRARLVHTWVSVDGFTDAVNAEISFPEADRTFAGVGVVAESVRLLKGGGTMLLRGSLDYERLLDGSQTTTHVSGENLNTKSMKNSILLGLSGVCRQGSFSFGTRLSGGMLFGSDNSEYTGSLNFIIGF